MRRNVLSLLACLVAISALPADAVKKDAAKGASLVGKWGIKSGVEKAPPGATFEFTKDGKLILSATFNGNNIRMEGTYKREGNKLTVMRKLPNGRVDSETDTIDSLTDKEMILIDPKGKKVVFVRK